MMNVCVRVIVVCMVVCGTCMCSCVRYFCVGMCVSNFNSTPVSSDMVGPHEDVKRADGYIRGNVVAEKEVLLLRSECRCTRSHTTELALCAGVCVKKYFYCLYDSFCMV